MTTRAAKNGAFAVCIHDSDEESDLVFGKLYRVVKPERNDHPSDIRVIDDSGEDYLYPRRWFVPVAVPPKVKRALVSMR
ncbi:MAG: hypothetical protein FJ027_16630 [Candidatus Rokubacteria bacterium]|nr:hypothetical protein [Candidatus Rokubacteria bacterium]